MPHTMLIFVCGSKASLFSTSFPGFLGTEEALRKPSSSARLCAGPAPALGAAGGHVAGVWVQAWQG